MKNIILLFILIRVFPIPGEGVYYLIAHSKEKSFYTGGDFNDKVAMFIEMEIEEYQMREIDQ